MPRKTAAVSVRSVYTIQHAPGHVTSCSQIRRMYACLAETCQGKDGGKWGGGGGGGEGGVGGREKGVGERWWKRGGDRDGESKDSKQHSYLWWKREGWEGKDEQKGD